MLLAIPSLSFLYILRSEHMFHCKCSIYHNRLRISNQSLAWKMQHELGMLYRGKVVQVSLLCLQSPYRFGWMHQEFLTYASQDSSACSGSRTLHVSFHVDYRTQRHIDVDVQAPTEEQHLFTLYILDKSTLLLTFSVAQCFTLRRSSEDGDHLWRLCKCHYFLLRNKAVP